MKIGIVIADFHKKISSEMLKHALAAAKKKKLEVVSVVKATGAFDCPLPLKRMLAREDIEGAVVLGAVVQGETAHDEVVAYTAAGKIAELSLKFDKPVGYGICGPRMTKAQAKARAKGFALRAIEALAKALGP